MHQEVFVCNLFQLCLLVHVFRRKSSLMLFSECLKVKSERHHDSGKNFDYGSYTKYTFYNHGPHAEKIIM